jgi:hypothetical protein
MTLALIAAVAGVYVEPGGAGDQYLDFADAGAAALVADGDTLLVIVHGSSLGSPTGGGWTQRAAGSTWATWTKKATAFEPLPTMLAYSGDGDATGALLVYRNATQALLVAQAQGNFSSSTMTHQTSAATAVDTAGLLLGLWTGSAGGPAPNLPLADPVETVIGAQSSNASGSGKRWFVVGQAPIAGVPNAGALTLTTVTNDHMAMEILVLRDRPPPRPAPFVDLGAGANIGLLP